jgi:hypothetical protein
MQTLEFEQIKGDMQVLYKKGNEIFATKVISTSLGHPSTHTIRLQGGFVLHYDNTSAFDRLTRELQVDGINKAIYADNALNRTELLLESETILTDLNTE